MNEQWSYVQTNVNESVGVIYLVPTPIGNLDDMSFRAVKALKEAEVIAAEDTRHTRKLLTHFDIHPQELVSYHEHNRHASGPRLIEAVQAGKTVALVSDAGMPGIADPGYDLVQLAVKANVRVIPLPGPNAALTALVASGQLTQPFCFLGFLPREKKPARTMLEPLRKLTEMTFVCYEAPHRIRQTLERLTEVLGNRPATAARELTKKHEHFLRGSLTELSDYFATNEPRGEFVLIIGPAVAGLTLGPTELDEPDEGDWWKTLSIADHVAAYIAKGQMQKEAMRLAAKDRGLRKRDIYQSLIGADGSETDADSNQ